MSDQLHGRRVVCASPRNPWFGHVGTITNANSQNVGVKYDNDPNPFATGRWIKKSHAVSVSDDGIPQERISEALEKAMARVNVIHGLTDKALESAALAIDIYNRSGTSFRASGFLVMMVVAWTSAMLAKLTKDGRDPHYYEDGMIVEVDGAPKVWSPEKCLANLFPSESDPVRANLHFAIQLRNRIVHSHCPPLDETLFGECQALVNNFMDFMAREFKVTFPHGSVPVLAIHAAAERTPEQLEALKKYYGPDVRSMLEFISEFREDLDDEVFADPRYRYRVLLVPQAANRERQADVSVTFIHSTDPDVAEKISEIGVLVREKQVPIHGKDKLLPSQIATKVEEATGFRFSASTHHPKAVAFHGIKGTDPDGHPERTDQRYCVWSEPYKAYLYTRAWLKKLISELATEDGFQEVVGWPPRKLRDEA